MSRLIDADELYKLIEEDFNGVCVYDVDPSEAVSDFQSIVDRTPTVDAEPVRHGRWEMEGYITKCSACGYSPKLNSGWNYCPNCGAKMRETE